MLVDIKKVIFLFLSNSIQVHDRVIMIESDIKKLQRRSILKKKRNVTIVLALLVTLAAVWFFSTNKNAEQSGEEMETEQSEKLGQEQNNKGDEKRTIRYENGDYVFLPTDEDIVYDREERLTYYKNILDVFLVGELSDKDAEELAHLVEGNMGGRLQGAMNTLQLQVEADSYHELQQLADRLMDEESVKYAGLSTPIFPSDLNSEDSQTGGINKVEYEEDDRKWWLDSIHAYSAWDYMDRNHKEFERVRVDVVELGNLDKNDPALEKVEVKSPSESASNSTHAEVVTKIIGGDMHSQGIRGVAAGAVDVAFWSMNDAFERDARSDAVVNHEVIAGLKYIVEDGAKIINNSWGERPVSELNFEKTNDSSYETYDAYLEAIQKKNDLNSAALIVALDSLLDSGYDFLFVQSAGNGFKPYKEGEEDNEEKPSEKSQAAAEYTGFFANINPDTFDKVDGKLNHRLEDIRSHIIVVGGAEKLGNRYESPVNRGYGNSVDIAAPSEEINMELKENYGEPAENKPWSGTSFAAPMVSGAAALVWSHNPDFTADQVKERLIESTTHIVIEQKGEKDSYPLLNVANSLNPVLFTSDIPPYYNELVETYRTAIDEQWNPSDLEKEGNLGPNQYEPSPLPLDYGYVFADLNGDGFEEMIVGTHSNEKPWIQEIYTITDKKSKPYKAEESAIRRSLSIYKNGTIEVFESYEAGRMISTTFYDVDKDRFKDGYVEDLATETYASLLDTGHSFEPGDELSEEAVNDIRAGFGELAEFTFTKFVDTEE